MVTDILAEGQMKGLLLLPCKVILKTDRKLYKLHLHLQIWNESNSCSISEIVFFKHACLFLHLQKVKWIADNMILKRALPRWSAAHWWPRELFLDRAFFSVLFWGLTNTSLINVHCLFWTVRGFSPLSHKMAVNFISMQKVNCWPIFGLVLKIKLLWHHKYYLQRLHLCCASHHIVFALFKNVWIM